MRYDWISKALPGLGVARGYKRSWLKPDLVAGATLSAALVPAGMAYAEASGLPAVTGLYASVVPMIFYAVFGPSRVVILGPDSALAPMIAAAILRWPGGIRGRRQPWPGYWRAWPVKWVIVAAEPITGLDTTALDELVQLDDELAHDGISMVFAEMKGPVKDRLIRFGATSRFTANHFYPTINTAVRSYKKETGVE